MNITNVALPAQKSIGTLIELHPRRILGIIVLIALMLNTAELAMNPPTLQMGDAEQWWEVALNVSHGMGYVGCAPDYFPFCGPTNQVTASREPIPVLLLALVARLTHDSLFAAGVLQVIVNLLILLGVFLLTRELANTHVALIAALLWAFYLPAVYYVPEIGGDLPAIRGVTFALFFFMRGLSMGRTSDWLAAGASMGLAALSRTSVLILVPFLVLGLVLLYHSPADSRPSRFARWRAPVLFALALAALQLPWVARNYIAFGRPVVGTTLVGYNLYRYNYALPTPSYLHFVEPDEARLAIQALLARRTDLTGTENEAQMDAVYRDEALRIIAAYPLRYTIGSGYRFLELWFNWGVGATQRQRLGDIGVAIGQLLLMALAAIGARRWQRTWPLVLSIIVYTVGYMLVVGRLRYILPVMPLTISLAALGVAALAMRVRGTLRERSRRSEQEYTI